MGRQLGIDQHYPPLSKSELGYLLGVPAIIAAIYKLNLMGLALVGPWIAVLVGLFAVGWAGIVLQRFSEVFEKAGYNLAMDDITFIVEREIERARFKTDATMTDFHHQIWTTLQALRPKHTERQGI